MRKRGIVFLLACVMMLVGVACGSKEVDLDQALTTIETTGTFNQKFVPVTGTLVENYYPGLSDISENYRIDISDSGGWGAEEIAIIQVKSGSSVDEALNLINSRLERQRASFDGYVQEEFDKLNQAVVVSQGDVAIMIVSADSAQAQTIADNILKGKYA